MTIPVEKQMNIGTKATWQSKIDLQTRKNKTKNLVIAIYQ